MADNLIHEWRQLWTVTLVTPSGLPMHFKLRAPSEAILRDRIAQYKPEWTIARDEHGLELIGREATS